MVRIFEKRRNKRRPSPKRLLEGALFCFGCLVWTVALLGFTLTERTSLFGLRGQENAKHEHEGHQDEMSRFRNGRQQLQKQFVNNIQSRFHSGNGNVIHKLLQHTDNDKGGNNDNGKLKYPPSSVGRLRMGDQFHPASMSDFNAAVAAAQLDASEPIGNEQGPGPGQAQNVQENQLSEERVNRQQIIDMLRSSQSGEGKNHHLPGMKTDDEVLKDMEKELDRKLKPCEGNNCDDQYQHKTVFVYNNFPLERFMCDWRFDALTYTAVNGTEWSECKGPIRLHEVEPTIDAAGMRPVRITKWRGKFVPQESASNAKEKELFPCDVPCVHEGSKSGIIGYFGIEGTDWEITYSLEASRYYPNLRVDPMGYRKNKFFATTSFKSDVPLPYYSWAEYNIQQLPIQYDDAIQGASFIASNCHSTNGRETVVKELQQYMR